MKIRLFLKKSLSLSLVSVLIILNSCSKTPNLPIPEANPDFAGNGQGNSTNVLYTEQGTNKPFSELNLQITTPAVDGSTILVNKNVVEVGSGGENISRNFNIHTLMDSYITATDAPKFKRWWQLDGKTHVFRLFTDEVSLRDKRGEHPRIEAFTGINWTYNPNVWHTWEGRYTIVHTDANGTVIFQNMNSANEWSFQLKILGNSNNIILDDRNLPATLNKVVLTDMVGKSFDVKARDNGKDWECYINGTLAGKGSYNRPEGKSSFRWGLYATFRQRRNSMIFVSGVRFD